MTARILKLADHQRARQRRTAYPDTALGQAAAERDAIADNASRNRAAMRLLDERDCIPSDVEISDE